MEAELVRAEDRPATLLGQDALARLAQFDTPKFNILQPVVIDPEAEFSGTLAFSVGIAEIVPSEGDTYHDFVFANKNDGRHALSALGLQKIARSAGVKCTSSQEEYRRDPETGHVYCRFKATVYMVQPNGQPYEVEAHASNDTATLEEKLTFDYSQDKTYGQKLVPGLQGAELTEKVRKQVLQVKGKIEERTETEAMNRAFRKAFGLKQTYTEDEIKGKPFVTLRVVERPSVHDAKLAIEQGTHAASELYGSGAGNALPPIDDQAAAPGVGEAPGSSADGQFERTLPSDGQVNLPSGQTSAIAGNIPSVPDATPTLAHGEGANGSVAKVADGPEPGEGPSVEPSPGEEASGSLPADDFELTSGRFAGHMVGELIVDETEYLALALQGRTGDGLELPLHGMRVVARWLAYYEAQA